MSVTPTVWVRPRQGPKLADLIAEPNTTRAHGDSDPVDILGSAYAATDGDPATAWTAPQRVVQHKTPPTLTLTLPRPHRGRRAAPGPRAGRACPRTRRWWPSTSATVRRFAELQRRRAADPVAEAPGHRHRHRQPARLGRRHRPQRAGLRPAQAAGAGRGRGAGRRRQPDRARRRRPQPGARDRRRLRPRPGHRGRGPVRAHLDPDHRGRAAGRRAGCGASPAIATRSRCRPASRSC